MTIGAALTLIAVGAILKWAVTAQTNGFDIQTAGLVLFIVGICALPLALLWTFWWPARQVPVDDPDLPPYPEPPTRRY